jgi:hypothetical protein
MKRRPPDARARIVTGVVEKLTNDWIIRHGAKNAEFLLRVLEAELRSARLKKGKRLL